MPIWSNFSSEFMQIWVDLSWRLFGEKKKWKKQRRKGTIFFAAAVKTRQAFGAWTVWSVRTVRQRRETQKSRKEFHSRFNSVLGWCYVCCKKVSVVGRKNEAKKKATKKKKKDWKLLRNFITSHPCRRVNVPSLTWIILCCCRTDLVTCSYADCYCADSAIAEWVRENFKEIVWRVAMTNEKFCWPQSAVC